MSGYVSEEKSVIARRYLGPQVSRFLGLLFFLSFQFGFGFGFGVGIVHSTLSHARWLSEVDFGTLRGTLLDIPLVVGGSLSSPLFL